MKTFFDYLKNKKNKIYSEAKIDDKKFSADVKDDLYIFIKIDNNTAKLVGVNIDDYEGPSKIKEESYGNFKRKNDLLVLKKGWEDSFNQKKVWAIHDDYLKYEEAFNRKSRILFNKAQLKTIEIIKKLINDIDNSKDDEIKILPEKTRKNVLNTLDVFEKIKKNYKIYYHSEMIRDILKNMELAEQQGRKKINAKELIDFSKEESPKIPLELKYKDENEEESVKNLQKKKRALINPEKASSYILKIYKKKLEQELSYVKKEMDKYNEISDFRDKIDKNNKLSYVYDPTKKSINIYSTENQEKIKQLNEFQIKKTSRLNEYINKGEIFLGLLENKEVLPITNSTETTIEFNFYIPPINNKKQKQEIYAYSKDYNQSDENDESPKSKNKGLKVLLTDKNFKKLNIDENFSGFGVFNANVFSDDLDDLKLEVKVVDSLVPIENTRSIFRIFYDDNIFYGTPLITEKTKDFLKKDEAYVIDTNDNNTNNLLKKAIPSDYVKGEIVDGKLQINEIINKGTDEYYARYINNKIYAYNDKSKKLIQVSKLINPKIYDRLITKLQNVEQRLKTEESKPNNQKIINVKRKEAEEQIIIIDMQLKKKYEIYKNIENNDAYYSKKSKSARHRDFNKVNSEIKELLSKKHDVLQKYKNELSPYEENLKFVEDNQKMIQEIIEDNLIINNKIQDLINLKFNLQIFDDKKIELTPEQLEEIQKKKQEKRQKSIMNIQKLVDAKLVQVLTQIKTQDDKIEDTLLFINDIKNRLEKFKDHYMNLVFKKKLTYKNQYTGEWQNSMKEEEVEKNIEQIIKDRDEIVQFLISNPDYQEDIFDLQKYLSDKMRMKAYNDDTSFQRKIDDFNKELTKRLNDLGGDLDPEDREIIQRNIADQAFEKRIKEYEKEQEKENELKRTIFQNLKNEIARITKTITTESFFPKERLSKEEYDKRKKMKMTVNNFNKNYNLFMDFIHTLKIQADQIKDKELKKEFYTMIILLEDLDTKTKELIPLEINKNKLIEQKNIILEVINSKNFRRLKGLVGDQLEQEQRFVKFKQAFFNKKDSDKINNLIDKYKDKIENNDKKINELNKLIENKKTQNLLSNDYYKIQLELKNITFKGREGVLFDEDGEVENSQIIYILEE